MAPRSFSGLSALRDAHHRTSPVLESKEGRWIAEKIVTIIRAGINIAIGWSIADMVRDRRTIQDNAMRDDSCTIHSKAFFDCVYNNFEGDVSNCQVYFEKLNQCRGSGASTFA